jgi:putative ATPase
VINQFTKEEEIIITDALVTTVIQQNLAKYDKAGEQHYDIISAFIKSMRASDPNASVYYLARMIAGGEDPLFICRRMIILASEDIGLANPNALLLANNCFQAVHHIGMPEGRIIMSQTAIYLACSPKSNASYVAINQALDLVKQTGDVSVPLHLRNAPTNLMKDIGYGTGYQYAHDYQGNFSEMECLPESLAGTKLYKPGHNAAEAKYSEYLRLIWKGKYGY